MVISVQKKKSQASGQQYNPQCNTVSVMKIRLDFYYLDFHEHSLP